MLCDQVEQGVVGVLRMLSFNPGRDYEVFSSASIRARRRRWLPKKKRRRWFIPARPETDSGWHFLTGSKNPLRPRPKPPNFRFSFDAKSNLFVTPAACWFLRRTATSRATSTASNIPAVTCASDSSMLQRERSARPSITFCCFSITTDPTAAKYSASILRLSVSAGAGRFSALSENF